MNSSTQIPAATPDNNKIVCELISLVRVLGASDNLDRQCLQEVAKFLQADPPMPEDAMRSALKGLNHAFRANYTEERPESFLLAAVFRLLQQRPPFIKPPVSAELSQWIDILSAVSDELIEEDAPAPPARGAQAAVERALQMQMMKLWLVSALHVRTLADAGQAHYFDPDQLPIGMGQA